MLGEMWKQTGAAERRPFEEQAKADKQRYADELAALDRQLNL